MRADILKSPPSAGFGIPPENQITFQECEAIRAFAIEITKVGDRPPLLCPDGMHTQSTGEVMIAADRESLRQKPMIDLGDYGHPPAVRL